MFVIAKLLFISTISSIGNRTFHIKLDRLHIFKLYKMFPRFIQFPRVYSALY